MFTGIIKAKGTLHYLQVRDEDIRLRFLSPGLDWTSFEPGESISVNGVCLTAVKVHEGGFDSDVSLETLNVTALGGLPEASEVNLEPAICIGERLGGHLVTGHVDCVGKIVAQEKDARSVRLQIGVPSDFYRYIARKGSVTVDGVSLTVNSVSEKVFGVNIIPHTAEVTIIDNYRIGTHVNVEIDLIARYLERLFLLEDKPGMTKDFLREHGYA